MGRSACRGWCKPPVWIHGDVAAGNLLLREGRLAAVIDFGNCGVGDPACELAIAWTLFVGESRQAFRDALAVDSVTWARGRAWTLFKALIVETGLTNANPLDIADSPPRHVIRQVLDDRSANPGSCSIRKQAKEQESDAYNRS